MKITFIKIWETAQKHKLTNEEFLSMCRSNYFNPFEDKLIMKIVTTIIVASIVMEFIDCIKKKTHEDATKRTKED